MPGPFPGMDPYLENPAYWRGVHTSLITYMAGVLNATLPPAYAASVDVRCYVVPAERSIYPDVAVLRRPGEWATREAGGGAAVAESATPTGVLVLYPEEMREPFIEIVEVGGTERVVTAIEILSPANKAAGSEGRELYLQKQREVLGSETHLLEIDLLRSGMHTVAAPENRLRAIGAWDYLICLHRSMQRYEYAFWMNGVRERLPLVQVPLTDDQPDVILDLQAVFDRCYDEGAFARRVDYRRDPSPPLAGGDAAWADALLREKGLRP